MFKHPLLVPCVAAALAGGCTMAPKYSRPESPVPATMPTGPVYQRMPATAAVATTMPAGDIAWQDFFGDERLRQTIATALANSRDLRIAALNVERARSLYGVQRAQLLPVLNANAAMSGQHIAGETTRLYDVNLGVAQWEIDFFGRIRSLKDAALQEYLATEQARNSAQISLISSVAGTYLTLAADRDNLKLAQTTLAAQQSTLDLVQRRFERGLSPELDVYRARTQVESARGEVARFTQLVALDENALNLLAGSPLSADLMPPDLAAVVSPREIAPGLSSDVLLRRPDILAAEDRLKATYANIGAARAVFFPRISLTAAVGTASRELSGLFKAGSETWSYSPQIVMPIFDARVWAARRVTDVDRKIALADYERAIQTSFKEAADALAVRGTVNQQVAAQESLVSSVAETFRLSQVRYQRGIDSYLSVLDAQRSLYSAQQGLVSLRLAEMVNRVRLYAVLGGGWRPAEVAVAQSGQR